jgi:hypothetical protein
MISVINDRGIRTKPSFAAAARLTAARINSGDDFLFPSSGRSCTLGLFEFNLHLGAAREAALLFFRQA